MKLETTTKTWVFCLHHPGHNENTYYMVSENLAIHEGVLSLAAVTGPCRDMGAACFKTLTLLADRAIVLNSETIQ